MTLADEQRRERGVLPQFRFALAHELKSGGMWQKVIKVRKRAPSDYTETMTLPRAP